MIAHIPEAVKTAWLHVVVHTGLKPGVNEMRKALKKPMLTIADAPCS